MLQRLVMEREWLSDLMVFLQLVVCEPSSVFYSLVMVLSWGLKAFASQEAFPVRLQAGKVFLLEVGLSLLVVPPDVCRLVIL